MIKNVHRSSCKVLVTRYSCQISTKLIFSRQIFEKYSNMKFHENPSSGRQVVPCGQTDRHDEANSRFSQFCASHLKESGLGSSVGIPTGYGAGRSGDRIPVVVRFSAPVQTGPRFHPASCTIGTVSFPGVKSGRGVTLTPHPLLVP
jgi:hypothetical protein